MSKILCKIFGHKPILLGRREIRIGAVGNEILRSTDTGWKCIRCHLSWLEAWDW